MPRWRNWTWACVHASATGALERCRIAVLVGQGESLVARGRDERRERDPGGGTRRQPYAAPETEDRIEHSADRVGEWVAVDDRQRRPDTAPAAEKPGAVGLILHVADRVPGDDHVRCPDLGLAV